LTRRKACRTRKAADAHPPFLHWSLFVGGRARIGLELSDRRGNAHDDGGSFHTILLATDQAHDDSERLARFRGEAQVLASINHPHIGGIYGLEDSGDIRGDTTALVISGPIDWAMTHTSDDLVKWLVQRDSFAASMIHQQVLTKGHHALLIFGEGHFWRHNAGNNLVARLEALGTSVFTISTPIQTDLAQFQSDVATWPTEPDSLGWHGDRLEELRPVLSECRPESRPRSIRRSDRRGVVLWPALENDDIHASRVAVRRSEVPLHAIGTNGIGSRAAGLLIAASLRFRRPRTTVGPATTAACSRGAAAASPIYRHRCWLATLRCVELSERTPAHRTDSIYVPRIGSRELVRKESGR